MRAASLALAGIGIVLTNTASAAETQIPAAARAAGLTTLTFADDFAMPDIIYRGAFAPPGIVVWYDGATGYLGSSGYTFADDGLHIHYPGGAGNVGGIATANQRYDRGIAFGPPYYFSATIALSQSKDAWDGWWAIGLEHWNPGSNTFCEHDIQEEWGKGTYVHTLHWIIDGKSTQNKNITTRLTADLTQPHRYATLNDGTTVRWYFDDEEVGSTPATGPCGLDTRQMLVLTTGSHRGESPPHDMVIREVRVYQGANPNNWSR